MKYRILNLVTLLAMFATRAADAAISVAVRSAEAADDLAVKVDTAAYNERITQVRNRTFALLENEAAAYAALTRARAAVSANSPVVLAEVQAARAKHSLCMENLYGFANEPAGA